VFRRRILLIGNRSCQEALKWRGEGHSREKKSKLEGGLNTGDHVRLSLRRRFASSVGERRNYVGELGASEVLRMHIRFRCLLL